MADAQYTKQRQAQFRGPSTSDDTNSRIEENYKDLVVLYNQLRLLNTDMGEQYRHVVRELLAMARVAGDLETRVTTLERADNRIVFYSTNKIDTDRFNATVYNVVSASRLSLDLQHGILTLPKLDAASLSKLSFTDNTGNEVVPPTLETRVAPDLTSADSATATIDSSQPEFAVIRRPGRIWERNVVAASTNVNGAIMTFYLKAPTDLFTTDKSNAIVLHAYPAFSTDILEVAYTTNVDNVMQDSDSYTVLNSTAMHSGNTQALTWVPPGGFGGDTYLDSGPRTYYFDPRPITGLRLKLKTRHYNTEGGAYVYSYGLSRLDLRYDRFSATGRTILRFDAPTGKTISTVKDVQPQIWNATGAEWPTIFTWRPIWETSFNSGTYTLAPVSLSQRVWIEVTLNQTLGGGTPALSGVLVDYA
jgi:hypothetical protein